MHIMYAAAKEDESGHSDMADDLHRTEKNNVRS
jgi:hypothetical protein